MIRRSFAATLLFVLFSFCAGAQYAQISHFAGAMTYGSYTVAISTTGSVATNNDTCLGLPLQYHSGITGAGRYEYALSAPVYGIYVEAAGLNAGPFGTNEYLEVFINGSPYVITPADVAAYSNCGSAGAGNCYLTSGRLYGPLDGSISLTHYNGGKLQIFHCSGITSFSVGSNGSTGGVSYHVSIDTTALPPCEVIASTNAPMCDGPVLNLYANSSIAGTYAWTGPGGYTSTLQNPSIPMPSPTVSGTYTVVQTVGMMSYTDSVVVNVYTAPSVTASSNSPVCEGDTLSFHCSPYIPGITYSWTGSAAFTSTLQNPEILTVSSLQMGTYNVYTDLYGCKDTVEVYVVTTLPLNPFINLSDPICEGQDLSLSVSPIFAGETFSWSGPLGFTSTTQSPVISPAKLAHSGTYSVICTLDGCDNTATVDLTVQPSPDIVVTGKNSLCVGDTLLLIASFPGALVDTLTYTCSGPGGFFNENDTTVIYGISAAQAGTYSVVAALGGCTDTVNVPVVITPLPQLITTGSGPMCEGSDLILFAGPAEAFKSFKWVGPNGFTSTQQYPEIPGVTRAASGIYTVTATLNGCSRSSEVNAAIVPLPAKLRDTLICTDVFVGTELAIALPTDATVYWSTRETTDKVFIRDTGKYWMQMSAPGCVTSDTVHIAGEFCGCGIIFPNAFSPNGDGHNDHFGPIVTKGCNIVQYQFAIYDRWANKIFLSQNLGEKWDGTYDGRMMDLGVYAYFVSYKVGTGKEQIVKGDFTLVR